MKDHDERWEDYFIDGTNVLKNNLGIIDKEELHAVEANICFEKLMELYENPIVGNFDTEHYLTIHKYIFDSIYPFAGTIRNVDMKKDFYFVSEQKIEESLNMVFKEMHEDFAKCKNFSDYVIFLAEFYYDILTVHPFREGNGRTTREFLREFVEYNMPEYELKWSNMDKEQLDYGMKYAYLGKSMLEHEFSKALVLKENINEINRGGK